MRVSEIKHGNVIPLRGSGKEPTPGEKSRALIALTPAVPAAAMPASYRPAPFIAHLLAVKDQHAQTRERRRAEPAEAIAAYSATASLMKR